MKDYLLSEIKKCIASWVKTDIYAISLFVYDESDNPCHPTVTLGYNTVTHFKGQIQNAFNEQEAKWNYAFWLQNVELQFGIGETQKIVKTWLADNNFPYISSEKMFKGTCDVDFDSLDEITETFVSVLIEIVQELHNSGFIKEQFGKEIPILIHELEYYDRIAEQNLKANPTEILGDFVNFCNGI